jgi:DNA (cytosine-5)-methyltransferase 1
VRTPPDVEVEMKQLKIFDEIIVDNFAGGGGASTGIELAIGHSVDIAINHDPAAIAMHKANHPETEHFCENVWEVNPVKAVKGRPVGLAWFSPDCKHFSKAKGGKPVEKKIRGLAWIVLKWAALVRPRVIMLENVEEFQTWGPLNRRRHPIKSKKGQTYWKWRGQLEALGYEIDSRELVAADYGAPTKRKRFFMVARCDGIPIVWPKPTHGDRNSEEVIKGLLKPYVPAAEIIDWDIPCKSIFGRKKPLAENTMKRIARGLQKFVVDNPEPFIMQIGHTGFTKDRNKSINEPLSTIVSKAEHCLITPTLIQYHSETTKDGVRGQSIQEPIMTLDSSPRYGLVSAFISKYYDGTYKGAGSKCDEPLHTVTGKDHNALVTAHIIQMNNNMIGTDMREPLNTIVAGPGHIGEVRAFLIKYYGQGIGQDIKDPLDTVVSKDRFGLVTVAGIEYQIIDIGLRMLEPHELFAAQGFPSNYIIDHDDTGKPYPKTAQVARCGNAVPPPFAEALVRANLPELCEGNGKFREVG